MKRLTPPTWQTATGIWIGLSIGQILSLSHKRELDFGTHAATTSSIWLIISHLGSTTIGCFGLFTFVFGFAYLWNRYSDRLEARRAQAQPQNLAG